MKLSALLLILLLFAGPASPAQMGQMGQVDTLELEKNEIMYQLKIYKDVTEYLDEVFRQFSDGYLDPPTAQHKINLLHHEYNKLVTPVPKAAQKLHDLVQQLLSRVENYFIYRERFFRESGELNYKIAKTKYELLQEADRLMFMYQ